MTSDQKIPALIAGLIQAGVQPAVIEEAVSWVTRIKLAQSVTGDDPMVRAFAFEQGARLERL